MKRIITIIAVMFCISASAQKIKNTPVKLGNYVIEFNYDSTAKQNAKGVPATIEVYKYHGSGGRIGREVKGFYKKNFTDVELLKFVEKANTDHKEKRQKGE